MAIQLIFFVAFCAFSVSAQENSYRATALAFYPDTTKDNIAERIEVNLERYKKYIEEAARNGGNLILFPEYGLTGFEVDVAKAAIAIPQVGSTPMGNETLARMSYLAITSNIYVIYNLLEEENGKYYSTSVAFDPSGVLKAKYRKINVEKHETKLSAGNALSVLETEFGKFGLAISKDLLYANPARNYSQDQSVNQILHSACHRVRLPEFAPLSIQAGYVLAHGLNVITSAYNAAKEAGLTGSSIIDHSGFVLDKLIDDGTSLLAANLYNSRTRTNFIVQGLPGDSTNPFDKIKIDSKISLSNYEVKSLNLQELTDASLCKNDFCCTVNGQVNGESSDTYKLIVATNNNRWFCGIVACSSSDSSSCQQNFEPKTFFNALQIQAKPFNLTLQNPQPVSVGANLLPVLSSNNARFLSDFGEDKVVLLNATRGITNVLSVGIWSEDSSGGSSISFNSIVFILSSCILLLTKHFV